MSEYTANLELANHRPSWTLPSTCVRPRPKHWLRRLLGI